MWPFEQLGNALGGKLQELMASAFQAALKAVWDAALAILTEAFLLADKFSVFVVDTRSGPVGALWPMMLWVSGVLAVGLFFWQITVASLQGGRGFLRLLTGPVQYGIALAITVSMVGGFLVGADGLTEGILRMGLQASNFRDALSHTTFADGAVDGVKAHILGICAIVGVLPAAVGYVLEMLFREAAIYVLVATVPITAAGLLANVTAGWFWKSTRWMLACIAMKPVLAVTLVLGVGISGGSKGLSGLLAGVGVLLISLFVPFVLFRLFAFVDPGSDAGAAFRDALSGMGVDSYGANNPVVEMAGKAGLGGSSEDGPSGGGSGGGSGRGSGGGVVGSAQENANTMRFDAGGDDGEQEPDSADVGRGGDSATSSSAGAPASTDGGSPSGAPDSGGSTASSDDGSRARPDDSDHQHADGDQPTSEDADVVEEGAGPPIAGGERSRGTGATSTTSGHGPGGDSGAGSDGWDGHGGDTDPPASGTGPAPEPPGPDDNGDGNKPNGGGGAAAGEADAAVIV